VGTIIPQNPVFQFKFIANSVIYNGLIAMNKGSSRSLGLLNITCLYMESCVFGDEDFPKENQKLVKAQPTLFK
ncbi:hypothetical protein, partial [Lacinutrix sp. MEBiC02404]